MEKEKLTNSIENKQLSTMEEDILSKISVYYPYSFSYVGKIYRIVGSYDRTIEILNTGCPEAILTGIRNMLNNIDK